MLLLAKSFTNVSILLFLRLVRAFSSHVLQGVENQQCYLIACNHATVFCRMLANQSSDLVSCL